MLYPSNPIQSGKARHNTTRQGRKDVVMSVGKIQTVFFQNVVDLRCAIKSLVHDNCKGSGEQMVGGAAPA